MKEVYLVRHSAPFVSIKTDENVKWSDFNRNMILDNEGEENALSLLLLGELKKVDKVYSADSARAIETIKYVAENSDVEIEVDKELNEREIGVEYKKDIPDEFLKKQFEDETYKIGNGESLKEAKNRITYEITKILENTKDGQKIVLSMHCVAIMLYLSNFCRVGFNGGEFKVLFEDETVHEGYVGNPHVFELVFDEDKVTSVKSIYNNSVYKAEDEEDEEDTEKLIEKIDKD